MIGTTISHYKILEKLGEGGMGVVYKAEDTKLKRFVALKFLPPELTRTPEAKERFMREAQAAAVLDHPHICPVYEVGEAEGQTFIVMSYVEGQSLHKRIESGPLNPDEAAIVAIQVAEGLQEAHEKGIIHRDIKSANIMLTEKGQAKIMDFGLAKLVGRTKLTDTATIMGTVDYMSPEQARGEPVDHRTDIWSLGVVLYEMLTGHTPFDAPSNAALVHKIIYDEPPELQSVNPDVPPGLCAVVARAMAKDKEDRYASASEFLRDIRNYELLDAEEAGLIKRRGETRPMGAAKAAVSKRTKLGITAAAIAALVCVCVALTVFLRRHEPVKVSVVHEAKEKTYSSIVVLPFTDMSEEKDQEYFCDGISEELINALSRIQDLRVIARTSAFSFKGKDVDIQDIGERLNVETVLEGSVRSSGNKLRITAQLVNVADNSHLWSDRYEKEMKDIFAVQDEITEAIVDNLKIELLGVERTTIAKRHDVDPKVYDLYLRGRFFFNKATPGGMKKAIEQFEQAIEEDPDYAPAYTGLADSYVMLVFYNPSLPQKETFSKAGKAALKALEIDDTLAEAHISLGVVKVLAWELEVGEKEFRRAIELNPGSAYAHYWYSHKLVLMGRFDEAIREIEQARQLDPLSPIINRDVGATFFWARQYDKAIEALKKTLEMFPNILWARIYLGRAYMEKSMYEEALAEFQKEKALLATWHPFIERHIAAVYARMGRRAEAQKILDDMLERSKDVYVAPTLLAIVCFELGESDQGFEWLDKAYEDNDMWLTWLKVAPWYDSVRSDPRYTALLKKIGLDK